MAIETVDKVLSNIKIIASVPISQNRFTDDYIRYLMLREMDAKVYPALTRQNQEYLSKTVLLETSAEGVLTIPDDAYLQSVISIRDVNGKYLNSVDREHQDMHLNNYSFVGNTIHTNYKNDELEVVYVPEAKAFVETSSQATVVLINESLSRLTVSAPIDDRVVDIITPLNKVVRESVIRTGGINTQVTLDDVSDVSVGDYILTVGTTPFVGVSSLVVRYLERCVANALLEEIQDTAMLQVGKVSELAMLNTLLDALSSRGNKSTVIQTRRRF